LILDARRPELDLLVQVEIEGEGVRAVLSPDGRLAYVLTFRPGRSVDSPDAAWIHAVDLDAGKLLESAALANPPFGITLDRSGKRLFLSRPDRIDTLTTRPLASSWHYRSPGINRGLHVTASDSVLHVARGREVAQFDPRLIAARPSDLRQKLEDDSTRIVPLPIESDEIIFSEGDRLAAAIGRGGQLSFFDPRAGVSLDSRTLTDGGRDVELLRPIHFPSEGQLLIASFPAERVVSIPLPGIAAVSHDLLASSIEMDEPVSPSPLSESAAVISPAFLPEADEAPLEEADQPTQAEPRPALTAGTLRGHVVGDKDLVEVIIVYGPDSIIREEARASPGRDGTWQVVVSHPGKYRLLPLGPGGRPLQSSPNFHTVDYRQGQGVDHLDFEILGTP
jgi:hypothetical protein